MAIISQKNGIISLDCLDIAVLKGLEVSPIVGEDNEPKELDSLTKEKAIDILKKESNKVVEHLCEQKSFVFNPDGYIEYQGGKVVKLSRGEDLLFPNLELICQEEAFSSEQKIIMLDYIKNWFSEYSRKHLGAMFKILEAYKNEEAEFSESMRFLLSSIYESFGVLRRRSLDSVLKALSHQEKLQLYRYFNVAIGRFSIYLLCCIRRAGANLRSCLFRIYNPEHEDNDFFDKNYLNPRVLVIGDRKGENLSDKALVAGYITGEFIAVKVDVLEEMADLAWELANEEALKNGVDKKIESDNNEELTEEKKDNVETIGEAKEHKVSKYMRPKALGNKFYLSNENRERLSLVVFANLNKKHRPEGALLSVLAQIGFYPAVINGKVQEFISEDNEELLMIYSRPKVKAWQIRKGNKFSNKDNNFYNNNSLGNNFEFSKNYASNQKADFNNNKKEEFKNSSGELTSKNNGNRYSNDNGLAKGRSRNKLQETSPKSYSVTYGNFSNNAENSPFAKLKNLNIKK